MSYFEERLAEIRAAMPIEQGLQTRLPKQSTAQAIRARLRASKKPVVPSVSHDPDQETSVRLDVFVELADQLRQEDVELTEK